jgi:hypothetical protein
MVEEAPSSRGASPPPSSSPPLRTADSRGCRFAGQALRCRRSPQPRAAAMTPEQRSRQQIDLTLAWSPWVAHHGCWLGRLSPDEPGLYCIRRVGQACLDYIGQTGKGGMTLRKRLGMQRGATPPRCRTPTRTPPARPCGRCGNRRAPPWRPGPGRGTMCPLDELPDAHLPGQ